MKEVVKIIFDKNLLLEQINKLLFDNEDFVRIGETEIILTQDEINKILIEFKNFVDNILCIDYIYKITNNLPKKINNKFKKGGVKIIKNLDISKYDTSFTNCWYHKQLIVKAMDESIVQVFFRTTQTT